MTRNEPVLSGSTTAGKNDELRASFRATSTKNDGRKKPTMK